MTPTDYINAGYALSAHTEQSAINLAEADVTAAYIDPIVGDAILGDAGRNIVRETTMRLAFMLLALRNTKETRGGAKVKLNANSSNQTAADVINEMAMSAHLAIERVRSLASVDNPDAKVMDVCKIYFESNFINS